MKAMNYAQREMVKEHLYIVDWTLRKHIYVNESVQGLGWDDLYQSGCLALCEAALKYDGSCQFETFAQVFVRNRLIDICRKARTNHKNLQLCSLDDLIPDTDGLRYGDSLESPDETPDLESDAQEAILRQFARIKKNYNGITLKGIEALELRYKGYCGKDIAALYNVSPKHIFAWISRAKTKLAADGEIASLLDCCK